MSVTPAPRAATGSSHRMDLTAAGGGALLFRQRFHVATGTFTDLLADAPSHQGVLIDSAFEQHDRDLSRISEPGIDRSASMATRHPLKAGRP
jgi:sulfur dioxygenase